MTTEHDCGHACCDTRADSFHDHFLLPDQCPACFGLRDERSLCTRRDCGQPLADHEYGVFCP